MKTRYLLGAIASTVVSALILSMAALLPAQPRVSAPGPNAGSHTAPAVMPMHRMIVLTDIGSDPDDTMSLVRLLTYSNEIEIRGLVASTSVFQQDHTEPESILRVIDAYAKARPNLLLHEPGYPTAESLRARVTHGLVAYGMKGVGEGKDSPGSELILAELRRPDPRPLWISVWGGVNTLAQTLWKIRATLPNAEAQKLYAKLRVYTISDQDDAGGWIRKEFPSVFYICSPGSFERGTWGGILNRYPGANNEVISKQWLAANIQQGHGPLGAVYPDVVWGMEGDTPSFLSLIPNGLNNPEHPNWGGWGGRYELDLPDFAETGKVPHYLDETHPQPETRPLWTNASDTYAPNDFVFPEGSATTAPAVYTSNQSTIWRWREEFQNDFAARMCWATRPYSGCNHPPIARLAGPAEITVTEGGKIDLDARPSTDPDGDSLSFCWFQYREAGDADTVVDFSTTRHNLRHLVLVAPHVSQIRTVHFILKVTDKGTPALTRYQRVVVHIVPAGK